MLSIDITFDFNIKLLVYFCIAGKSVSTLVNTDTNKLMVPAEGVEPPRLSALDPKSSVSANSTTRAICGIKTLLVLLSLSNNFFIFRSF